MLRLLLLLLCLVSVSASAQDASRRVVLTDGSVVVGVVTDESADPVVVLTASGVEQRIPRARIVRIEALAGGRFARVDPTRTRLVFSPTGRTLGRRGQTRLGVLSVIVPNVTYAVTPTVDVGGAGLFFFGSDGGGVLVPGVKAQVVRAPGLDVALGASLAVPLGEGLGLGGGVAVTPYIAATVGSETRAATVGVTGLLGGSFESGDLEAAEGVLLSLGGETQVSSSVKLLAEVLVPIGEGDNGVLVVPGVRFFGDRFSADVFGFVTFVDNDTYGFAPLGSFTYNF